MFREVEGEGIIFGGGRVSGGMFFSRVSFMKWRGMFVEGEGIIFDEMEEIELVGACFSLGSLL